MRKFVEFPEKGLSDRLNPQVIRRVLFHIYVNRFDKDFRKFTKALNDNMTRAKRKKGKFGENTIRNIINDNQPITYSHLEGLSNYLGIPTFVFLMFTRYISDDEGDKSYHKNNIQRFSSFIRNEYEDKAVQVEDLELWIEQYGSQERMFWDEE